VRARAGLRGAIAELPVRKEQNTNRGVEASTRHRKPMSDAILTYRKYADWMLESARIASSTEDAERLARRAQRYMDLAERLEQQERAAGN
jgi:hypothetical protein